MGGNRFSDKDMRNAKVAITIDTKIDNFSNGGRWSCDFTDGQ
jgi:hypothetical protein